MRIPRALVVLVAGLALATAACGDDDNTGSAGVGGDERTVEVDMVDIAFEPAAIEVQRGETVRFVFTNNGESPHDAFIGNADAQAEHETEMRDSDDMEHGVGHGDTDEDAVTVEPGDTGELTHTFDEAGTVEIGCHQAGHYAAGMKIDVTVS